MVKKRSRARKKNKPKDSRVVIAGEPFKAIAGLFAKDGSSRRSSRPKKKRS